MRLIGFEHGKRFIAPNRFAEAPAGRCRFVCIDFQGAQAHFGVGYVGGERRLFAHLRRARAQQRQSSFSARPRSRKLAGPGVEFGDAPAAARKPARRRRVAAVVRQQRVLDLYRVLVMASGGVIFALRASKLPQKEGRPRPGRLIDAFVQHGLCRSDRRTQIASLCFQAGGGQARSWVKRVEPGGDGEGAQGLGAVPDLLGGGGGAARGHSRAGASGLRFSDPKVDLAASQFPSHFQHLPPHSLTVTNSNATCVVRTGTGALEQACGSGGPVLSYGGQRVAALRRQQTIAGPAVCAGIGVHSGAHVRLVLSPADADTGIVFIRSDVRGVDNIIRAHADSVGDTRNATTLRNEAGVEIATIEHLMSACMGLGVDNLIVEVDGPELPILDGSSAPFVQVLLNAGLKGLTAPQRVIRILEPVEVQMGAKTAALLPAEDYDGLDLDVTIRFADAAIGVQRRRVQLSAETFLSDIADARTFGFLADVDAMRAAGLGRGASMDNTVVVGEGRVQNPEGLRFDDEFVRHKLLDAVGDLSLAGAPICGRFVADQPGHALNALLVRALLDTPEAWRWEIDTASETGRDAQRGLAAAAG